VERNKKSLRSGGLEPRPEAVATGAPRRVFIPNPENKSPLELVADQILTQGGDKIILFKSKFIGPSRAQARGMA
jgi:hypothetical protein